MAELGRVGRRGSGIGWGSAEWDGAGWRGVGAPTPTLTALFPERAVELGSAERGGAGRSGMGWGGVAPEQASLNLTALFAERRDGAAHLGALRAAEDGDGAARRGRRPHVSEQVRGDAASRSRQVSPTLRSRQTWPR